MKHYDKIMITGGSGSGKTFLGKRLSRKRGIKLTSLDEIAYDFSKTMRFDHKRTLAERRKLLDKVLGRKRWIIEGGYFSEHGMIYDQADVIIFLRPSTITRLANTLKRYFARMKQGKNEGFRNYLSLTAYNLSSINKWQKHRPEKFKKLFREKIFFFESADEAFRWFG